MPPKLLLDTGALVSLLDRSQSFHKQCVDFFDSWEGPVISTEAVLTEATRLLGTLPGGRQACVDFFLTGAARLVPSTLSSLERCKQLLDKYSDLPMDFTDATLVVLAEDLQTDLIFTMDRNDFKIYRISGGKRFKILPS